MNGDRAAASYSDDHVDAIERGVKQNLCGGGAEENLDRVINRGLTNDEEFSILNIR